MNRQKSFENNQPTLYIVATPIGNLKEMTPRAIDILSQVDVIACEDTRVTMKLLSHFDIHAKCISHHLHNEKESTKGLVKLLAQGHDVALVSDAGYPLLSDPGQYAVEQIIEAGFNVVPISGCNAAIDALVASGICAQPYVFYGFLGNTDSERNKSLKEIKDLPYTVVVYEAPHRIKKMLEKALEILGNRKICLAREMTKMHEEFLRGTISEVLQELDEPRGEIVVVIEKEERKSDTLSMAEISNFVEEYIEQGMTTKEAIKKVAQEYGISKNELYKEFHHMQQEC